MESLCSEHLLGRWIWKSVREHGRPSSRPPLTSGALASQGRTRGEKHTVPWNVQNINTNPENFVWEKDRCAITCVAPGLYEVTFGFFIFAHSLFCLELKFFFPSQAFFFL